MLKISMSKIAELYARIAADKSLFLPIEKAGQVEFYPWNDGEKVRLDALNTVKSAKDFFFPQSETLMSFQTEGKNISVTQQPQAEGDSVYFGVRGCDAKSFEVLDRVFLSDPIDTFYQSKREHGVIVALACSEPEETCFCGVFGVDPLNPTGDVTAWIVNNNLYWRSNTEKGDALTESVKDLFESADKAELAAHEETVRGILEQLPFKDLSLEGFNGDALDEKFNSEKWKELSKACLGCGTCTFVCPTCQCYDIRDYDTGNGVQRYRCWDSCMYSDFTRMAHGNPRTSQVERFRQRFMHKLVYFPANNEGMYSCVGCGRCLQKCPISMNIVKVIKSLGGENK